MQIVSTLLSFLQLLDQLYKSLIGVLWYTSTYYGLNPHYTFLQPFLSNTGYVSLTQAVFNGFYFQFAVLVLLFASIATLILNVISKPGSGYSFLLKWIVAVLLGGISFFVVDWMMAIFGGVYSILFHSSSFSWYNFLNFSSYSWFSSSSNVKSSSLGVLVEFFTLTGYFVSITSLFTILMLRQALMLFSIVLLPFATILGSTEKGRKIAAIFWEIIIEMSIFPFLVLLSLYLAHTFGSDVPLQLAFLFLPSIIPGLLFRTGNSFLSAPLLGFLGGLSFSSVAGRGFEAAKIVSAPFEGGSFKDTIKNGMTLPLGENHSLSSLTRKESSNEEMPWKALLNEELKERKQQEAIY